MGRDVGADGGRARVRQPGLPEHPQGPDVLRFSLAQPRRDFGFRPICAAYLNLIEPWWMAPLNLALKGHRFGT